MKDEVYGISQKMAKWSGAVGKGRQEHSKIDPSSASLHIPIKASININGTFVNRMLFSPSPSFPCVPDALLIFFIHSPVVVEYLGQTSCSNAQTRMYHGSNAMGISFLLVSTVQRAYQKGVGNGSVLHSHSGTRLCPL